MYLARAQSVRVYVSKIQCTVSLQKRLSLYNIALNNFKTFLYGTFNLNLVKVNTID